MNFSYTFAGTLPKNAPMYIERQADKELYQLLKSKEFCYVFNSRKVGKSSLRVRVMSRLQEEGFACAAIDLSLDEVQLATPEQWYYGLIDTLVEDFELDFDLKVWWNSRSLLSPLAKLQQFIATVLLEQIDTDIVIFIDEIDSVLSFSFPTDDFFALIRGCYNSRSDHAAFNRLGICLLGVTTPTALIQNKQRTPFNIGHSIELTGFTLSEAQPLVTGLVGKVSKPNLALEQIILWTQGQPFLTQKLCYLVAKYGFCSTAEIEQLVQTKIIDNWEYQDEPEHLKTIRDRLLADEKASGRLLEIYQNILQSDRPYLDDNSTVIQLKLSGLVVRRGDCLRVYNPIYQAVFDRTWIEHQLSQLRPYAGKLSAWFASNCQDNNYLLNKLELHQAQQWSVDKSLTSQDYQYLNASLNLERLKAEQEAKNILVRARQQARTQRLWGILFFLGALIFSGWTTWQLIPLRHQRYSELQKRISVGEKILSDPNLDKRAAAKQYAEENYIAALQKYQRSRQSFPLDPEALIYANNAQFAQHRPLTIAISVPLGKNRTVAQEMLRGIAQAQQEINLDCRIRQFNRHCGIRGQPLQVKIVNDDNDPEIARELARELVKDQNILAVVGHNASDVSIAAAREYQGNLVMISPTSFYADFAQMHQPQKDSANYIFRTVVSIENLTQNFAQHIDQSFQDRRPKLVVCFDSDAVNSKASIAAFKKSQPQIELIDEPSCDFSNPNLNYDQIIKQTINQGANSLFLAPHIDRIHEAVKIAKVNHQQNLPQKLRLFSGPSLYTSKTLEDLLGRSAFIEMQLLVPWHPNTNIYHHFTRDAQRLWNPDLNYTVVTWRSAATYDATQAIVRGLKKNIRPTRKSLQRALSQPDFSFNGATGRVEFANGERVNATAFLLEVRQVKPDKIDFVPLDDNQGYKTANPKSF